MNAIRTIAAVAIGAALAFTGAASAAPPLQGTTTVTTISDIVVSSRQADGNTIITEDVFSNFETGTLTGTASGTYQGVIHPDGSAEFHGTDNTFTGTFAGCGSAPVSVSFAAEFKVSPAGDFHGKSKSIAGAPITFVSSFQGSVFSPVFTETETYRC